MATISFTFVHMYFESTEAGERFLPPKLEDFENLQEFTRFPSDGDYYEVKVAKKEDGVWFCFDFGSTSPRDTKLTNVQTGEKKNNPRESDELELLKQFFAFYCVPQNLLYIPNTGKKNLFAKFLTRELQKKFIVENIFKNAEEIKSVFKIVNKISFSHVCDLFNGNSTVRRGLLDLTGVDAPQEFSIETKYSSSTIIPFILKLIGARQKNELSRLVITGRDKDNFPILYNIDTFVKKIEISCQKNNETGKFNEEDVFNSLKGAINHVEG